MRRVAQPALALILLTAACGGGDEQGNDEPAEVLVDSTTTSLRTATTRPRPTTSTTSATTSTVVEPLICPVDGCVLLEQDFEPSNLRGLIETGYQAYVLPGAAEQIAGVDTRTWSIAQWQEYGARAIPNFYALVGVAASTNSPERVRALAEQYLPVDENSTLTLTRYGDSTLTGRMAIDNFVSGGYDDWAQIDLEGFGHIDKVFRFNGLVNPSSVDVDHVYGIVVVENTSDVTQNNVDEMEYAIRAGINPHHGAFSGLGSITSTRLFFDETSGRLVGFDLYFAANPATAATDETFYYNPDDYVYPSG